MRDFADSIAPEKVDNIVAALHIEERVKRGGIEDFIENVHYLIKRGFKLVVFYVLHPHLITQFQKDYEFFQSSGVRLLPKPFKGWYRGKMYPRAYSKNEKKLILAYSPYAIFYPFCFKGFHCNAGRTFIRIDLDGTVIRCVNDKTVLGHMAEDVKFYDRPKPCRVYRCSCFGYKLIDGQKFERHNSNYNNLHERLRRLRRYFEYVKKR